MREVEIVIDINGDEVTEEVFNAVGKECKDLSLLNNKTSKKIESVKKPEYYKTKKEVKKNVSERV